MRGLYEGIDPGDLTTPGLAWDARSESRPDGQVVERLDLYASADSTRHGWSERRWRSTTGELSLAQQFLDALPDETRSVDVAGQKLRLSDYASLWQMRRMHIAYGEVRSARMSHIQNVRTVLERWSQRPDDQLFSVRYARRFLELSGVGVTVVAIEGDEEWELQELLDWYETDRARLSEPDPDVVLRPGYCSVFVVSGVVRG